MHNPKNPPQWLVDLTMDFREAIRKYDAMHFVRTMIVAWAEEVTEWYVLQSLACMEGIPADPNDLEGRGIDPPPYSDGIDLLPVPDRKLTANEKFAICGAIHDLCWKGERIDPWNKCGPPNLAALCYYVLLSRIYARPAQRAVDDRHWKLPETEQPYLREILEDVKRIIESFAMTYRQTSAVVPARESDVQSGLTDGRQQEHPRAGIDNDAPPDIAETPDAAETGNPNERTSLDGLMKFRTFKAMAEFAKCTGQSIGNWRRKGQLDVIEQDGWKYVDSEELRKLASYRKRKSSPTASLPDASQVSSNETDTKVK
jgi:hypothetical protein